MKSNSHHTLLTLEAMKADTQWCVGGIVSRVWVALVKTYRDWKMLSIV